MISLGHQKVTLLKKNMIDWVQHIFISHLINIRTNTYQENHPVLFIVDKPIYIIQLPPDSSNVTQLCNGCSFCVVKIRYS